MPGDIIYSIFTQNNTLVMEENERKEHQESRLETSSQIRQDKKGSVIKANQDGCLKYNCSEISTICNNYQDTLPSRVTTTALVETSPRINKERFDQIKQFFIDKASGDASVQHEAGAPEEAANLTGYRSSNKFNNDSKTRPLFVNMPEIQKDNIKEEYEMNKINLDNIQTSQLEGIEQDGEVKIFELDEVDGNQKDTEKEDCACLVTCIYYTQQFCDCCIL